MDTTIVSAMSGVPRSLAVRCEVGVGIRMAVSVHGGVPLRRIDHVRPQEVGHQDRIRDALGAPRAVVVGARDGGVAILKAIAEILHVQPAEPRVALAKKAAGVA